MPEERYIGRVPVRNLWLLMLYASDLARISGRTNALLEHDLNVLPELIGKLLSREVERRLRRNLSRGYVQRKAVLPRVRGRIDVLSTVGHQLLDRGIIACGFDELTLDTPRNRLVRVALERLARIVSDRDCALLCRSLASDLACSGVSGVRPTRGNLSREQIGRNDADDRLMLALAQLAFDLALPTEDAGVTPLPAPDRSERWVRQLFEKAVAGFYLVELSSAGWIVSPGTRLNWQVVDKSSGLNAILPGMKTDIIVDRPDGKRIVVDTKFTSILTSGWYRDESLKSEYLYQIYSYLRSQEQPAAPESPWNDAAGVLLHPAVGVHIDEGCTIQGHHIRFVTVDLTEEASSIRSALRRVVCRQFVNWDCGFEQEPKIPKVTNGTDDRARYGVTTE